MAKRIGNISALYPAASDEPLAVICAKVASAFRLPPFKVAHRSAHLETAETTGDGLIFTIVEYFGAVDSETAKRLGKPDYWNLAWRAAVGLDLNYQVGIRRPSMTRNQQRTVAGKLRPIFKRIRLHGDSRQTTGGKTKP